MPFELDLDSFKSHQTSNKSSYAQTYRPPRKRRIRKPKTNFDNCYVKVGGYMISHVAFQTLTASQVQVLLLAQLKDNNAKHHKQLRDGRPIFNFTYAEAKVRLGISGTTFNASLLELVNRGFLKVIKAGGLKGPGGGPTLYAASDGWKRWTLPPEEEEKRRAKSDATSARFSGRRKNTKGCCSDI